MRGSTSCANSHQQTLAGLGLLSCDRFDPTCS